MLRRIMASSMTSSLLQSLLMSVMWTVALTSPTQSGGDAEYSVCSRSCGGGVQLKRETVCSTENASDEIACVSVDSYIHCNSQECPDRTGSYQELRQEQCAHYNDEYTWKPILDDENKCSLFCMATGNDGERFYRMFSRDVIDGTPCDRTGNNVCVNGTCMPIWCDGKIGETGRQSDACLNCGGEGRKCITKHGQVETSQWQSGYHELVTIPAGATSITVRENEVSGNYIAVRSENGDYYLNGDDDISPEAEPVEMGGTTFEYQRLKNGIEYLSALGPLTEPLIFELVKLTEWSSVVSYDYSQQSDEEDGEHDDEYVWMVTSWSACNSTCGEGWLNRDVNCISRDNDDDVVDDSHCSNEPKPASRELCDQGPCTASWTVSEWNPCPASCGKQTRLVSCEEDYGGGVVETVDTDMCDSTQRPVSTRDCESSKPCNAWIAEPWSECDQLCGSGEQSREVHCKDSSSTVLPDSDCDVSDRPEETRVCDAGPCRVGEWVTSEWSDCDRLCGSGEQSREVHCKDSSSIVLPDSDCDVSDRPEETRVCDAGSCDVGEWVTSEWSDCDQLCGSGEQSREVHCKDSSSTVLPDSDCDVSDRPEETRVCDAGPCRVGEWVTSEWSDCDQLCGSGEQSREVHCEDSSSNVLPDSDCDVSDRPEETRVCDAGPCGVGEWVTSEWSDCDQLCGSGEQSREVHCKDSSSNVLPDSDCDVSDRPEETRVCDAGPCRVGEWVTSEWSDCDRLCGSGEQSREVHCKDSSSNVLPDSECDVSDRPEETRVCDAGPCRVGEWVTSEWSGCQCKEAERRSVLCVTQGEEQIVEDDVLCDAAEKPSTYRTCPKVDSSLCRPASGGQWFSSQWDKCSTKCGHGVQRRHVFCGTIQGEGEVKVVSPSECDRTLQPSSQQECIGERCLGTWFLAPFGKCSVACGGGVRHRVLMCFVNGTKATPGECDSNARPESTEDCNLKPCDEDNLIIVGERSCHESTYGCCPDGLSAADGPENLGCVTVGDPTPSGLCIDSEFGCCLDGFTAAQGPFNQGCAVPTCKETHYGCCTDGKTPASGPASEGCPRSSACAKSTFGCCSDGKTSANGFDGQGCDGDEIEQPQPTKETVTFGPPSEMSTVRLEEMSCMRSPYGCCGDDVTPREGPNGEGCPEYELPDDGSGSVKPCELSAFGCCPDRESLASGPDGEGCVNIVTSPDEKSKPYCQSSIYGCCEDGVTSALGDHWEGCPSSVGETENGCAESSFGCCLDGKTAAAGPRFEGCSTAADEAYKESCVDDPYGCCPDGVSSALGPALAGCEHRMQKAAVCSMPKETGPCGNFTIWWHFDVAYGDCTRFWYGGCGGNENRFETKEQCRNHCVSPTDSLDRCYLPRTVGRCRGAIYRFFYNSQSSQCDEFVYGGCLGNDNRFETIDDCQQTCQEPQKPDTCRQPVQKGPCKGSYARWYFDSERDSCVQFKYGGCLGNDNKFTSLEECESRCTGSALQTCSMEKDPGPCQGQFYRWYFDTASGQCMEFVYSGCGGNKNLFLNKAECDKTCEKLIIKKAVDRCSFARDPGTCASYYERWYFDSSDGFCKQFVYGGCGGNENRFDSEPSCRESCDANTPIDACLLPVEINIHCAESASANSHYYFDGQLGQCVPYATGGCGANANKFESIESCRKKCAAHLSIPAPDSSAKERCLLPRDPGPCLAAMMRWHYSPQENRCVRFEYGGCGGNRNRFLTEDACNKDCRGVQVTESRPEPTTTITTVPEEPETVPGEHLTAPAPTTSQFDGYEPSFHGDDEVSTTPVAEDGHVQYSKDVCRLSYDTGSCTTFQHQWYFDGMTGACKRFLYGGCDGNENRFETQEDCERKCLKNDVCSQTVDAGRCLAYVPMFYYDRVTDRCLQFVYGGCGGNDNRFQTRESCEQRCRLKKPEVTGLAVCSLRPESGPCRDFVISWYFDHEFGECTEFTYGGCEGNANRFETKEQCQQSCQVANICRQSADSGPCRSSKARYFYDVTTGECQQFTYGGCNGNGNRFLTLENCQRVCNGVEPSDNEVDDWTEPPALSTTTKHWKTSKQLHTTTMTTTPEPQPFTDIETHSTVVDDEDDDLCSMERDTGPCSDYRPVWYFEPVSRTCRRFLYGGCDGNGNKFNSSDECESRCLLRDVITTTVSPVDEWVTEESTDDVEVEGEVDEESDKDGENGEESETEPTTDEDLTHRQGDDSVKDTEDDDPSIFCQLKADEGEFCVGWELYWHYDALIGQCRQFYYGGCSGNANKFETEESCQEVCMGVIETQTVEPDRPEEPDQEPDQPEEPTEQTEPEAAPTEEVGVWEGDICGLPVVIGSCEESIDRWHWDQSTENCERFEYSGCDGNENNFETEAACLETCGVELAEIDTNTIDQPVPGNDSADPSKDSLLDSKDCSNTVFGCCPDGLTVAHWWNFLGCPEEMPVISEGDGEVQTEVGSDINLPCSARGSPRPQISWFKNGQPLIVDSRISVKSDGSLLITEIHSRDASTYTCLAFNSVGRAMYSTNVLVNVPAEIQDEAQVVDVRSSPGETVRLPCIVTGTPQPTIHWTHDGNDVIAQRFRPMETGLEITDVQADDSGEYICQAWNGYGSLRQKQIILTVEGPLTVKVESTSDTEHLSAGQTVVIVCRSEVSNGVELTWNKNGQRLWSDDRIRMTSSENTHESSTNELTIDEASTKDTGEYSCTATRGQHSVTSSTLVIKVKESTPTTAVPATCVDKPWYANCELIVEANLCRHPYFSVFCCKSCRQSGLLD